MDSFFAQFKIDYKILIAQLINFALILTILKIYLYGPILNILEKRQKKIEKSLKQTKEIEEKLEKTEKITQEKIKNAKIRADEIIKKTENLVQKKTEEKIKEAEKKVEKIMKKSKEEIKKEKELSLIKAKDEIVDLGIEIAKKVLSKSLNQRIQKELENKTVKDFLNIVKK